MQTVTICPKCGSKKIRARHVPKYHYRESGLDDLWLEGMGVLESICGDCGGRFVSILQEEQLLQVIAMDLLMSPGFLSGKEIRYLREISGLTQARLAELIGKPRRESIAEWETQPTTTRDQAWEFLLRAVLLTEFVEVVVADDTKRRLAKGHIKVLTTFSRKFRETFRQFFTPRPKPGLSLVKLSERATWQPAKAA